MLQLGVDEITVVLQLDRLVKQSYADNSEEFVWPEVAEAMIAKFVQMADFIHVFGAQDMENRPPQGYTVAYRYGEHSFYLAIAYHGLMPNMGVAVKFSAQALDYYCKKTDMQVYQFLKKVQCPIYTARLSRIDLTADYINEGIDVTTIYNDLMHNRIGLFRQFVSEKTGEIIYRRKPMKYEGYIKATEIPTIYVGAVQSKSRLRIYDKKREQIERKGTKYDIAIRCNDWVRFEGVFREEYAHQLTEALMDVDNDAEFVNLIACTLVQKYAFQTVNNGVVDCETEYTRLVMDCITNDTAELRTLSSRNNDLYRSIKYMLDGSGVVTTLYKIKKIWDADKGAVDAFLELLKKCVDEYRPNDDCKNWLKKNLLDMTSEYPHYDDYLNEYVIPMLQEGG